MENIYYMHIDPLNLAHYFSGACLKPARYFSNKNNDIQNNFEDYLLFSSKKWATNYDCSMEIVLTTQEKQELINLEDEVFLYAKALPITRVKNIYFTSSSVMDKTITTVEMGSAFIPRQLVAAISENSEEKMDYSKVKPYTKETIPDFTSQIRKFDSLMGGFALMNTVAMPPMNYSANYFSTLARFNRQIGEYLEKSNRKPDHIFWDAFEGKETFTKLFPYLNKKITKEDLEEVAQQEKQVVRENAITGLIDVNSLQQASYIIAILYNYGLPDEGRRNKINTLITTHFRQDVRPERSEVVALCYGLNRGYTAFANKYQAVTVKFRLDSKVDYNTIESLYQYAFNEVEQSYDFPYLEPWTPEYRQSANAFGKGYRMFDKVIFDTPPVVAQRPVSEKDRKDEWWERAKKNVHAQNEEALNRLRMMIEQRLKQEFQIEVTQKDQRIRELELNTLQLKNKLMDDEKRIAYQSQLNKEIYILKERVAKKDQEINELKINLMQLQTRNEELQKTITYLSEQNKVTSYVKDEAAKYETSNSAEKDFDYESAFKDAFKVIGNIEKITNGSKIKALINSFKKSLSDTDSSDKDLFTK